MPYMADFCKRLVKSNPKQSVMFWRASATENGPPQRYAIAKWLGRTRKIFRCNFIVLRDDAGAIAAPDFSCRVPDYLPVMPALALALGPYASSPRR